MSFEVIAMGDHACRSATVVKRKDAFAQAHAFRRDPQGCDFVTVIQNARLVAAWDKPGRKWKFLRVSEL